MEKYGKVMLWFEEVEMWGWLGCRIMGKEVGLF